MNAHSVVPLDASAAAVTYSGDTVTGGVGNAGGADGAGGQGGGGGNGGIVGLADPNLDSGIVGGMGGEGGSCSNSGGCNPPARGSGQDERPGNERTTWGGGRQRQPGHD